jgi:putative ABC transport system substrate-binding protein
MRRRDFFQVIVGSAVAWPLQARAQQTKPPVRIGFVALGSPSRAYDRSLVEAFQQGLRTVGLVENRDVVLDVVWASEDPEKEVSELMYRGAQMLIPCGSGASRAAQRLAPTIPIVFISVGDPIAMGLVENLARPGRNATGFSDIQPILAASWWTLPVSCTIRRGPLDISGIPDGRMEKTDIERPAVPPSRPV